jgi:hypothetical protein
MRQELLFEGKILNEIMTLEDFNSMIQLAGGLDKTYSIYKGISDAMERKYMWLGRQIAEELLDSLATSVIDRSYSLPFRANQHCLLIWDSGWFKSSILSDFVSTMPGHYFGTVGKISDAALRGTVEPAAKPGRRFVPPSILQNEFIIVREFGQSFSTDVPVKEILLTALEDQVVNVSLAKFAQLDEIERVAAATNYEKDNFVWDSATSFRYKTKVTIWAANYTPIDDLALLSRFNILTPQQELDEELRHHVMENPWIKVDAKAIPKGFNTINEAVDSIMGSHRPLIPVGFDLRKPLAGIRGITPRIHSNIIKKLLAASWWGFWYDSDSIRGMALGMIVSRRESQRDQQDIIIDKLKSGWFTIKDLASITGLPYGAIINVLKELRALPFKLVKMKDPEDSRKIYIHLTDVMDTMGKIKPEDKQKEKVNLKDATIPKEGEDIVKI